jgi:hypothetical protein
VGKVGGLIHDAKDALDSTKTSWAIFLGIVAEWVEALGNFLSSNEQDSEESLEIGWSLRT